MFYLASKEVEKTGRKILQPEDIVRIMSGERSSDSGRILATYKIVAGDIDRYLAIYPTTQKISVTEIFIRAQRKSAGEPVPAEPICQDEHIGDIYSRREELFGSTIEWSYQLQQFLANAIRKAKDLDHRDVSDLHLLSAFAEEEPRIRHMLDELGVNVRQIQQWLDYELKQLGHSHRLPEHRAVPEPQEIKRPPDASPDPGPPVQLDLRAVRILRHALTIARTRKDKTVKSWYLAEAILHEASLSTPEFYRDNHDDIENLILALQSKETSPSGSTEGFSVELKENILLSARIAEKYSKGIVDLHHLAMALLEQSDEDLYFLMKEHGFGIDFTDNIIVCLRWWYQHRLTREAAALTGPMSDIEKALLTGQADYKSWLSHRSSQLLELAQNEAWIAGFSQVGVEHLLLSIFYERSSPAADCLIESGIYLDDTRRLLRARRARGARRSASKCHLSPGAQRILELALDEARTMGVHAIEPEHILLAITGERDGVSHHCLTATGLDGEYIEETLRARMQIGARL